MGPFQTYLFFSSEKNIPFYVQYYLIKPNFIFYAAVGSLCFANGINSKDGKREGKKRGAWEEDYGVFSPPREGAVEYSR